MYNACQQEHIQQCKEEKRVSNMLHAYAPYTNAFRVVIGASLSEPHINGTAMREFYIIIMVRPLREIIYPIYPAMLYGHKREIFYCAFSYLGHGHSNLANCKFTLVLVSYVATVLRRTEVSRRLQRRRERDRARRQLNSARTS